MKRGIARLTLAAVLAGCGGALPVVTEVVQTATGGATPNATATARAIAGQTQNAAYFATAAVFQTQFAVSGPPIRFATPTPTRGLILTPTAWTDSLTQTAVASPEAWIELGTSPNGEWEVWRSIPLLQKSVLSIRNIDRQQEWVVEWIEDVGFVGVELYVAHWSLEGRYVYISYNPVLHLGCNPPGHFLRLVRLDLSNGKVVNVLPEGSYLSVSFSEDSQTIAYVAVRRPQVIQTHNFVTGANRDYPVDSGNDWIIAMLWSAGKDRLVFTASNYDFLDCYVTDVFLLNLETGGLKLLIQDFHQMYPLAWEDEYTVLMFSGGVEYTYDLRTGVLTPVEP